jgi:hypothetical protein
MAGTSYWYVTAAPPDRLARFGSSIRAHVDAFTADAGAHQAYVEWGQNPESVHGPDGRGGQSSPSAEHLVDAFRRAEIPEAELLGYAVAETEDHTWDLGVQERPKPVEGLFAAVAGVPVASILYVGLGPQRAAWLPGVLGVFSVAPGRVPETAELVRKAHALSPFDRSAALERMHDWLGLGHDHGYPVHHLLEALPEVFGHAAASGLGVFGVTGASQ